MARNKYHCRQERGNGLTRQCRLTASSKFQPARPVKITVLSRLDRGSCRLVLRDFCDLQHRLEALEAQAKQPGVRDQESWDPESWDQEARNHKSIHRIEALVLSAGRLQRAWKGREQTKKSLGAAWITRTKDEKLKQQLMICQAATQLCRARPVPSLLRPNPLLLELRIWGLFDVPAS